MDAACDDVIFSQSLLARMDWCKRHLHGLREVCGVEAGSSGRHHLGAHRVCVVDCSNIVELINVLSS